MTAPRTRVSDSWVALLPIEPEDQDGAAFVARYPEGAAVRLGLTDGIVLAHCREHADGESAGALAVLVATRDPCPDAGVVRVWRERQIIDSPLSGAGRDALRSAIPRQAAAHVVEAVRRGWGAMVGDNEVQSGTVSVSVPHGASLAIGESGEDEGRGGPPAGTNGEAEEEGEDEDYPDADGDAPPGEPGDGPQGGTIPAAVLAMVDDISLCRIRAAAADGCFGAHGYALIHAEFAARRAASRCRNRHLDGTHRERMRGALFHYVGLLADHLDGVA